MDNEALEFEEYLDEFPLTDSADPDWRRKFKVRASRIAAMRLRGLPREARQRVRGPLLKILDAALRNAYEIGDHHAAEIALATFDEQLLKAAMVELERMQKANGNGVADFEQALVVHAWNGLEIDTIPRLLEPGEQLARVDFRWIETSKGRRISRPEIQEAAKPSTQSNGRWARNFVSDADLRELEAAEGADRAPTYGRNLDFPGGIRPRQGDAA